MPYLLYIKGPGPDFDPSNKAALLTDAFIEAYKKAHPQSKVILRDLTSKTNPSRLDQELSPSEEFEKAGAVVIYHTKEKPSQNFKAYIEQILSDRERGLSGKPITLFHNIEFDVEEFDKLLKNDSSDALDISYFDARKPESITAIKSRAYKPFKGVRTTTGTVSAQAREEERRAREKDKQKMDKLARAPEKKYFGDRVAAAFVGVFKSIGGLFSALNGGSSE